MIKKERKNIIEEWKQKEKIEMKTDPRKGAVTFATHSSDENLEELTSTTKSLNLSPKVQSSSKNKKHIDPIASIPKSNNKSKIRKSKIRNKTALPSASESSEEDYESMGHSSNGHSINNHNNNSYYGDSPNTGNSAYEEQYYPYQDQRSVMNQSPGLQGHYSQQYHDPNMYPQPVNGYQSQVYQSQIYGNQPYMNGYGRPTTLLEAQEVNKQNQRQFLLQAKMNPVTHLSSDRSQSPQGGLVGAISAIQQHKLQSKAANFNRSNINASNSNIMHQDYDRSQSFIDPRMMGQPMSPLGQMGNNSYYPQEQYYDPNQSGFIPSPIHNGDYHNMQDPSMMYGNQNYFQNDDDDDVALGTLSGKVSVIKPTRINRSKIQDKNRNVSDSESIEDPDIPEDIIEAFDDFMDKKLQMKPYSYVLPQKAYDAFVDWCQDEDIDDYLVPELKVFDFMMENNGFVKKKKPTKNTNRDEEYAPNTKWWHNIALVD